MAIDDLIKDKLIGAGLTGFLVIAGVWLLLNELPFQMKTDATSQQAQNILMMQTITTEQNQMLDELKDLNSKEEQDQVDIAKLQGEHDQMPNPGRHSYKINPD